VKVTVDKPVARLRLASTSTSYPTEGRAPSGRDRRSLTSETQIDVGNGAKRVPRRNLPWERYVIGLDRGFDQFRRTFREQPDDGGEPKTDNGEGPSAWDHLRAVDEAIASQWAEDAASSLAGHSSSLSDPDGAEPVQVSLGQVALALGVGCSFLRRQRPRQARSNPRQFFGSGCCRARVS
jgi:hypothetical protein